MSESATLTPPPVRPPDKAVDIDLDQAPITEQEQFDAVVARDSKIVLAILAGVAILAALVMSTVALVLSSGAGSSSTALTRTVTVAATSANKPVASPLITLSVAGSNKRGPDGKMHDAFSKTNFAVKIGQPTRLRIDNRDSAPHSITSVTAGVSIVVMPGLHTYTMIVNTAGRFTWLCILPCDTEAAGWAMTHSGYMAGYITAS